VLEFRRHVIARKDDRAFWANMRRIAAKRRFGDLALGTSVLIASQLFGRFAPVEFEHWAVASVSPTVRLWADRYGVDAVLADFPGTKLFLLLEEELERMQAKPASATRTRLFPRHLGRMAFTRRNQETRTERLDRILAQLRFMLFRARFHVVAAGKYLIERPAWKRALLRLQDGSTRGSEPPAREMTSRKQLNDNCRPSAIYAGVRSTER
jgi:hypothetical protein